jgi:hypothetical protein
MASFVSLLKLTSSTQSEVLIRPSWPKQSVYLQEVRPISLHLFAIMCMQTDPRQPSLRLCPIHQQHLHPRNPCGPDMEFPSSSTYLLISFEVTPDQSIHGCNQKAAIHRGMGTHPHVSGCDAAWIPHICSQPALSLYCSTARLLLVI